MGTINFVSTLPLAIRVYKDRQGERPETNSRLNLKILTFKPLMIFNIKLLLIS